MASDDGREMKTAPADDGEQLRGDAGNNGRDRDDFHGGGDGGLQNHRSSGKVDGKDVCRDFLNNICNRGSRCKFYHPPDADKQCAANEPYNFCLDFQNKGCGRDNCRYVHAQRDDVDLYKQNGEVSLGMARALAALSSSDTIAGIPVCKQFQVNRCDRSTKCRYWHINLEEERLKRFAGRSCGGGPGGGSPLPQRGAGSHRMLAPQQTWGAAAGGGGRRGGGQRDFYPSDEGSSGYMPPPAKRPAYGGGGYGGPTAMPPMQQTPMPAHAIAAQQNGANAAAAQIRILDLERRNNELLSEIDSLRRENRRERERYEDLLSLFRQSCQGGKSSVPVAVAGGQGGGAALGAYNTSPSQPVYPSSAGGVLSVQQQQGGGYVASVGQPQAQQQQQQQQQAMQQPQQQQPAQQQQTYSWATVNDSTQKYSWST